MTETPDGWEGILAPGETIIWQGQPDAGIVWRDLISGETLMGVPFTAFAVVWVTMVIAFALWYWHLDCGGAASRANGTYSTLPAFRFPEQDIDAPAYADWYPQFIDYLAVSFNTATAFGPTDVSAVRHWSKLWLITESAISLSLIGLVVARAINEL